MAGWPTETIEECLVPLSLSHVPKLPATSYRLQGKYPIVDQGQNLVAGWTDSSMGLISEVLPLVVFGDHTRALKYIDFPFVRGADGTQILKPRSGIDPLYFYYACRAVELPSRGYNRHFTALKKSEISLPQEDEQIEIGNVLRLIEGHHELQRKQLESAKSLKTATMRVLFTHGLRGEAQKETEFGLVPAAWQETVLDNCATVQTGVAKGRKFEQAEMVDVPYLRVANVQDGHLDLSEIKEIHIRRSEVERYRLRDGDVVLTEGGDFDKLGRGFIWRGELDLCVHQNHVFAVRPKPKRLLPEFFAYLAQSAYGKAYFLKVAHKTTNLACINSAKLKAFPVPIPPTLDEQREVVATLDAIDRKIDLHRRKRAVLEQLFKTLLHKLMTGEIRSTQLDLSALASAKHADVAA